MVLNKPKQCMFPVEEGKEVYWVWEDSLTEVFEEQLTCW